jgi:hypothetical protein
MSRKYTIKQKAERAVYNRQYRLDHKDEIAARKRQYHQDHRVEIAIKMKQYSQDHRAEKTAYMRQYRQDHRAGKAVWQKQYYQNHKPEAAAYAKQYYQDHKAEVVMYNRQRFSDDIDYRLKTNIRVEIKQSIKDNKQYKHSIDLLGCSIPEARAHLERQFKPGMNWDNYGFYGWHIDHIIPLASFDFRDYEQQKRAWHYTNLQPLWAVDNMKKGCKIIEKQLILL